METTERKRKRRSAVREALPPGTPAKPFTLPVTPDQKVSLEDFAGSPLVLVFYPADFSPVCGDELSLFNEVLPDLKRLGANVVGISADTVWAHLEWTKQKNLHFPLLSDFHPKGKVCKSYGVFGRDGYPKRALVLVDGEGKVAWSHVSPSGVNPGVDGVLEALERLVGKPAQETASSEAHPEGNPS
jgi:peroxiredoxin